MVTLITGAGSGIGRETAQYLARAGSAIVCADLRLPEAEATAAMIRAAGGRAMAVAVNVAKQNECAAMAEVAMQHFGRIDGLVNCAGISKPGDSLSYSSDDWEQMIDIQLNGAFYAAQAVGKHMVAQRAGSIVLISSTNAEAAFPRRAAYCAAKAGVAMLVKVLAIEWAEHNVRVNAIGPAYVATDMTLRNIAAGNIDEASVKKRIPLGRLAQPVDVSHAAEFLLSDKASFITGQSLYVDGGWLAYGYI